jgi:hypothetical protein
MKKLSFFMLSLLALASVGCEKEPEGGSDKTTQFTIVASTDGAILPEWKAEDEITVVCNDEMYTFAAGEAGKTANFTEAEGFLTAEVIGSNPVAAYVNCTNMFGSFKIQAEQTWKDGANPALIPAYAYTMNAPVDNKLALAFKPLASVLDLTVAPYDIVVEKIVVAPAAEATVSEGALAGTYTVDASQGSVKVGNGLNEVVLNLAAPVDLKQGASFKIPLGWFTLEGGLAITMIYDGGKEYPFTVWAEGAVKSYNDEGGLKSSKLISETLEFDANSFPRAWYIKANATDAEKGLTWEKPTTLDYALANALPGSVFHLAAGTYKPTTAQKYMIADGDAAVEAPVKDGFKNFLIDKNITVIGGYPANAATGAVADAANNKTILDGDGKAYHTLVVSSPKVAGEKVVIEGITISGGLNTADATEFIPCDNANLTGSNGGGLALVNTVVDLKNVTISGNKAANAGGLYCLGTEVNMTNCTITGNESDTNNGGAVFTTDTKLVMDGCSIVNNKANGGFAGGAYFYVPAEKELEAVVKNSHFDNNTASGNNGGVYVRDDSGANKMKISFEGCTFNGNVGNMGACMLVNNARMTLKNCEFDGNKNSGNGVIYMYTTTTGGDMDVTFDGCKYTNNGPVEGAGTGVIGGIYMYTNANGAFDTYFNNCTFANNKANGRAGALYMRNAKIAQINLYVANCTFAGNQAGSLGSAINLYGTAACKVNATVVSCTATGNISTSETNLGTFCCETAGTTMNIYNTISSGNVTAAGAAANVNNKAGTMTIKNSLIGADYYGADGAKATVTPAFDFATMLSAYADGVVKLVGTAATNPAFGNGMTATDLKKLAAGTMTADVLANDQKGNARTDSDKVIGACVK